MKEAEKRFLLLISTISIAGFSQGLLLPVLSVILEKQGVSSSYNGLSSAALYVGMLLASPFMEEPLRKFGYKPMILFGMSLVIGAMVLFPLWMNFYFWIILRFIVGIGDHALHFATQVWITSTAPVEKRGRIISLYGLSYGIGFGIGPLGLILLPIQYWLPFLVAVVLFMLVYFPVLKLENQKPEVFEEMKKEKRYGKVYAFAGIALMPMFIYGFLEATLNASFPIYGLRINMTEALVSMILSSFIFGSLLFQFPLGYLSDRIGRKRVLFIATFFGGVSFFLIPFAQSTIIIFILFVLAGGFVGSLYSLGLAYVADLIPISLLPTANIIATIHFGVGSILGPYFGGLSIERVSPESLFYLIAVVVLSFPLLGFISFIIKTSQISLFKKATEE